MTYLNEFFLALVVVFSVLFLDLTGARASELCPKEKTVFARGDNKRVEYWNVAHISDICIRAFKTTTSFINDVTTNTPKIVSVADQHFLILCQKDGLYEATSGEFKFQMYAHCRPGGEGHHLEVTINGAKKVFEAETWQKLKGTFRLN